MSVPPTGPPGIDHFESTERLYGGSGPNTKCPGSDQPSLYDSEEMPQRDNASLNPVISYDGDRPGTEGAAENFESAETRSLDALHPDTSCGQSQYSLDVLVENHRDTSFTAKSDSAADVSLPHPKNRPPRYKEIFAAFIYRDT